jgi:hypothetical protein
MFFATAWLSICGPGFVPSLPAAQQMSACGKS